MRYFDASALVKLYVREKGSVRVRRLLEAAPGATSRLSDPEVSSALARRAREGAISEAALDRALAAFEHDLTALVVVEVTAEVVGRARDLLRRHPLRSGDAVQLASCLVLQDALAEPVELEAHDERLLAAAAAEGLGIP